MSRSSLSLKRIMWDSVRLYFAPLTGAWRGIREEFRRIDRDIAQRREAESRERPPPARTA